MQDMAGLQLCSQGDDGTGRSCGSWGASPWGWHLQFSQGEAGSLLYVHGPCQALISGLQNSGAPDKSTGPRLQKDHVERPGVRPPSSELGRSPGPFLYLSECQQLLEAAAARLPPRPENRACLLGLCPWCVFSWMDMRVQFWSSCSGSADLLSTEQWLFGGERLPETLPLRNRPSW